MKIYIYKKGQNFGPYTAEETMSRIKTGEFSKDDLGWCHGLPEATPLSQIIVDATMGKINPPAEAQSADIILAHERNIALKQKALICITAAWLVLGFMPMWESIAPLISLAFWLVHIAGIVVCCQLAVALKKNIGLWICITIIPGVNLFGFAKMAHDAGEMLKCRAVRCGIFGAKWGEIQKLKTN